MFACILDGFAVSLARENDSATVSVPFNTWPDLQFSNWLGPHVDLLGGIPPVRQSEVGAAGHAFTRRGRDDLR